MTQDCCVKIELCCWMPKSASSWD